MPDFFRYLFIRVSLGTLARHFSKPEPSDVAPYHVTRTWHTLSQSLHAPVDVRRTGPVWTHLVLRAQRGRRSFRVPDYVLNVRSPFPLLPRLERGNSAARFTRCSHLSSPLSFTSRCSLQRSSPSWPERTSSSTHQRRVPRSTTPVHAGSSLC